jgi:flagellar biosynthesis/type III secretory pathway chaperone
LIPLEDINLTLQDVLTREKAALVQGDFAEIEQLLPQKELLIATLGLQDEHDDEFIKKLQSQMTENQYLLDSAQKGVRAVSRQLDMMARARHGVETYTENGEKKILDARLSHKVERRA